jgi:hypothetical protein
MMESAAEVREALNVCQGTSSSLDVSHAGKHAMQTLSGCREGGSMAGSQRMASTGAPKFRGINGGGGTIGFQL